MGEHDPRTMLRLVDDPVLRVMQMLRALPLESTVRYLELISHLADQLGLLADTDRERIADLIRQVAVRHIDRAA